MESWAIRLLVCLHELNLQDSVCKPISSVSYTNRQEDTDYDGDWAGVVKGFPRGDADPQSEKVVFYTFDTVNSPFGC